MERVLNSIYAHEEDDPLQKQFKTLEMEWDSIKQSISRSNRQKPVTASDHRLFQLYDNSPKELMSLLQLQNENSPSIECSPNSAHHDRAAIEIIEQREADFDNGRLKGRRLLEELEECFDMGEKSEVSTEYSCKGFESCDERSDRFCTGSSRSEEAERGVTVVAVKSGGGGGLVGRLMICMVVMFALAIVGFKCSGEDAQILVPT